jgi:hypothetical protein
VNGQDIEFSTVLLILDLFFPLHHPISPKEMPPFNKSKFFTLPLHLSIFQIIIYFAFGGTICFSGSIFHKIMGKKHSVDHVISTQLTEMGQ